MRGYGRKSYIHIRHVMPVLLHQVRKFCIGYEDKCYNIYDAPLIIHSFIHYVVCLSITFSKGSSPESDLALLSRVPVSSAFLNAFE